MPATSDQGMAMRELQPAPFPETDEEDTDSEFPRRPKTWAAYWEHDVKGSPLLGAFNIICCVVGVGLLGLPYALSQCGWVGVPLLVLTCAMSTFTCAVLGDALHATPGATAFGDLGHAAYGPWGRGLVAAQQYITMVGVAAIFLVVLASGLRQLYPARFPHCTSNIASVGAVVSLHVLLHKLNEVAVLSAFNLVVAVLITGVVAYEAFAARLPDAATVGMNWAHDGAYNYRFLIAFPTIAFAFGCHTIIPAVHEELRDKATFRPLCYAAVPATLVLYLPVAVLGYWAFGDRVEDPIFKNFDSAVARLVVLLLLAHVAMSYAIIMNPPELALEAQVVQWLSRGPERPSKLVLHHRWPLRMALRLLLTGLTILIARAVPCFPILLSLVSSVTGTTTSFIFPVLFYLRLVRPVPPAQRYFGWATIAVASIGGAAGTYNAVLSLKGCHLENAGC